jgi:anti-sigma B factor antagonist
MSPERQSMDPADPESLPFGCDVVRTDGAVRVRLAGALDMATVPLLAAQLDALVADGERMVTVDLGGLAFMDSSGLRLLLDRAAHAREDGFGLAILPGPPAVQRVFAVTGTLEHLPFIER